MADERETVILTQPQEERFRHAGSLAVQGGAAEAPPLRHRVGGEVVHSTPAERPLVHMLMWDDDCACTVQGRVVLAGDPDSPFAGTLQHRFPEEHRQTHAVRTSLAEPIHHALQLRTPLELRFCNTWHVASDYTLDIAIGQRRLASLRLTGATVARPQPCDEPCPPVVTQPVHP